MMGNPFQGQHQQWHQQVMKRQREMGGYADMQKREAMKKARIPDRPLTGDPFTDVEQQAAQLRALVAAGQLSQAQLGAYMVQMMVQDGQGQVWMVGAKSGQWHRFDGAKWVPDSPPRRGGRRSVARSRRTLGALFNGLFATGALLWLALVFLAVIDEHFIELESDVGMLIAAGALFVGLAYTVRGVRKARRGD
jgi:hypothetical protein